MSKKKKVENNIDYKKELENLRVQNGLTSAILGRGQVASTQISEVDTLFKSTRFYMVSNMRQLLSQIYVEHGIVRTIVDIPVDDALNGGVEITSEQLSPDEIEILENKMKKENDMDIIAQANKWNRLFGGAAILLVTNQDYKEEFEINNIKKGDNVSFKALDLWELFYSKQNVDDNEEVDFHTDITRIEHYDYYGKSVHKSRVLKFTGVKAPSFIRARLRGWGFSVLESIIRPINQYLKATETLFEVLDEFKIDVYKIKGLADTLSRTEGESLIQKRVQLANQQKNLQNAVTMDSEDDYIQKQLLFTGLAESMDGIRKQLASDLRIPMNKLFGISSSGFASGEDDIENYNSMVESTIRAKTESKILKIVEIRCQQLFGYVPDDLDIAFKPLRILSNIEEQEVKTQKFNRVLQSRQMGDISTVDFKEAINKDDLLPIKIEANEDTFPVHATAAEISVSNPKGGMSKNKIPKKNV